MSTMHCSLLSLGCVFGFATVREQTSLSALHALRIAQRRLRPEVRAKLLSISSARTDESLVPEAWRFVFHDAATSGHCRIVTVAAKTSSEHPDTVEAFSSFKAENVAALHPIAQNKLLINSDKALELARGTLKLKGLKAVEYRLTQQKSSQEALWTLHFFAENGDDGARCQMGAKTGTVQVLNAD
ncbi:MAG: hypothetical protein LV479_11155 [Methylacidiphilales bacterium]|nr:hypothetical protein [Candidatus Methylacidiphilales bacterium]